MQKFALLLLTALIIGCCYAEIDTSHCYNVPKGTLYYLYKNCRKASDSRQTRCMNVVDRYCSNVEFAFVGKLCHTTGGVMRAVNTTTNEIFLSCFKTAYKGQVEISSLLNEVPACNHLSKIQSGDCLLAINRYCQLLNGRSSSGFAYSTSVTHASIACYDSANQSQLSADTLALYNSKCDNSSKSASSDCFNAACLWCEDEGYDGGITQGSNNTDIIISCYNDYFRKHVKVQNIK